VAANGLGVAVAVAVADGKAVVPETGGGLVVANGLGVSLDADAGAAPKTKAGDGAEALSTSFGLSTSVESGFFSSVVFVVDDVALNSARAAPKMEPLSLSSDFFFDAEDAGAPAEPPPKENPPLAGALVDGNAPSAGALDASALSLSALSSGSSSNSTGWSFSSTRACRGRSVKPRLVGVALPPNLVDAPTRDGIGGSF